MILAVCADDRLGMSFGGRRQSKDAQVRRRLWELSGGNLRMSDYSARQFEEPVYHGSDYLSGAADDDWCFAENPDYEGFSQKIGRIILFRWNRHYPSDVRWEGQPGDHGFILSETSEFPGKSHEKITKEVYVK